MRILAMAELHKQLYAAPRVDRVDVGKSIQQWVPSLVEIYSRSWQEISPKVSTASGIHLDLDILTPFGLMLHELVSNVMKHAFPARSYSASSRRGILFVTLSRVKPHHFILRVEDTGIGLPRNFEMRKQKSLGMALIVGLVEEQLGGQIRSSSSGNGSAFEVEFTG